MNYYFLHHFRLELGDLRKKTFTTHREQNTPQEQTVVGRDKAEPGIIECQHDDEGP
jgi:hypothetical protein